MIILLIALGGMQLKEPYDPAPNVIDVFLISSAELEAIRNRSQSSPLEPLIAPEPTPAPAPPPPRPEPAPEPEPAPAPEPEAQPEPTPPGEVTDTLAPPAPLSGTPDLPEDGRPTPRAADRIAPLPAPAPEPEVETAPEAVTQSTAPAPSATPVEAAPEAAPEEATTEIVTEAETPSGGPLGSVASIRPPTRPERPRPVETAAAAPDPTPPQPSDFSSGVADLLAQIVPDTAPAQTASSQPLSVGERQGIIDQLDRQVQDCWSLGSLSTEAQGTKIVLEVHFTPDARPIYEAIRMTSFEGGSASAAQVAFEFARRAIVRCATQGRNGYNLPSESYEEWREIDWEFDPSQMRRR